jgi:hypothetical protein
MSDNLTPDKLAKMSNTELVEAANQLTGRLSNQDWQKVILDLRASGHIHTFAESAPPVLKRFLRLEVDLDEELARTAMSAPLLSTIALDPKRPRGDEKRLAAVLISQDESAMMHVDVYPDINTTVVSFKIKSMLTLRFNLPRLDLDERRAYLDSMRRDEGLAILWTRERWEQDFVIFTKKEFFSRVFAFSPHYEATARLANEATGALLDWLERCWFPRGDRKTRTTAMLPPLESVLPPTTIQESPLAVVPPTTLAPVEGPPTLAQPGLLQTVFDMMTKLPKEDRERFKETVPEDLDVVTRIFESQDRNDETELQALRAILKTKPDVVGRLVPRLISLPKAEEKPSEQTPEATAEDPFKW